MTSPLRLAVCPRSLEGGLFTKFLNECPLDYTTFVVSWKVGIPYTGLTIPMGGGAGRIFN